MVGPDAGRSADRELLDPRRFGARYDGVSDDSTALQAAIAACANDAQWGGIVISGPLFVATPVFIDRPVDRSNEIFHIQGRGNARLINGSKAPIFDSKLKNPQHPLSEYILLSNLSISGKGSIFSRNILRMSLERCYIGKISVIKSDIYIQSLDIMNCRFVEQAEQVLIASQELYNLNVINSHFERTGVVIEASIANGVNIAFCVFESCLGPVINIDGVNNLNFSGNYVEGNYGPIIELGRNSGKSRGVFVTSNNIKNTIISEKGRYEIILGRSEQVFSAANFCGGNLYDNSFVGIGGIHSASDYAEGRVAKSEYPISSAIEGSSPAAFALDLSSSGPSSIIPLRPVVIVNNATDKNRTIYLSKSVSSGLLQKITVINGSGVELKIKPTAGLMMISGSDVNLPVRKSITLLEYEAGKWCSS